MTSHRALCPTWYKIQRRNTFTLLRPLLRCVLLRTLSRTLLSIWMIVDCHRSILYNWIMRMSVNVANKCGNIWIWRNLWKSVKPGSSGQFREMPGVWGVCGVCVCVCVCGGGGGGGGGGSYVLRGFYGNWQRFPPAVWQTDALVEWFRRIVW